MTTPAPLSVAPEAGRPTDRMPALFIGHGAPPLLDDPLWGGQLAVGPVAGGGYRVRATLPYCEPE